jgi:hypothetical protein
MAYSDFSLRKVKQDFGLTVNQSIFLPLIEPVSPGAYFAQYFERNLRLAIALSTEKARSELLISPILMEVRDLLNEQISLFSGEEFNVEPEVGLNGVCDYLISRSPQQLLVESPIVVLVEAKKEDLKGGLGQCVAEMIAAQRFNQVNGVTVAAIHGVVTSGKLWQFLRLEGQTVAIDPNEYAVPPVEPILGILKYIATA